MEDVKEQLLADVIQFYEEYQTEDGIHPGVGWVYCDEDGAKYGASQDQFDTMLGELIEEGKLMGRSEKGDAGLEWHGLMPVA